MELFANVPYLASVNANVHTIMELLKDPRKRRSESMSKDEHKAFIKYVATFPTKLDAAFVLGFSRITLDSVLIKGSGKPETIHTIREKLGLDTEQKRA